MKTFVINLDSRKDRWENTKKELEPLGLELERFSAIQDPRGGRYGCWKSHVLLWEKLKNSDEDTFLIFEDDVALRSKENFQAALQFFKKENLPILNLHNHFLATRSEKDLYIQGFGGHLHAYLISKKFANHFDYEKTEPNGRHIDVEMNVYDSPMFFNENWFCKKEIFYQKNLGSNNDNNHNALGIIRKIFGDTQFIDIFVMRFVRPLTSILIRDDKVFLKAYKDFCNRFDGF